MGNTNEHISTYIHTKKLSKDISDNDIHALLNGRKILWRLFIFMDPEAFPYSFR